MVTSARQRTFTAIELLLYGGIVAVLALVAVQALQRARDSASTTPCMRHLNAIGQAILLYATDHGARYPDSFATLLRIGASTSSGELTPDDFLCQRDDARPAKDAASFTGRPSDCSFAYLGDGLTLDRASDDVLVALDRIENHDREGFNALFGDGHIAFIDVTPTESLNREIWADVQAQIERGDRPVRWRRPTTQASHLTATP